jgi:chromosome segregation ATPase
MSFILKDEVNKLMNGVSTDWKRGSVSKGCERIYDMLRPIDKEYEKIWFWSVGNTLLADTLDDAMKVAYYENPHYRVITKTGEFIDMSGAMTKILINARSS